MSHVPEENLKLYRKLRDVLRALERVQDHFLWQAKNPPLWLYPLIRVVTNQMDALRVH